MQKFASTEMAKKLETEARVLSTRVDKHTGELKTLQELVRDLKMMPRPSTPAKVTQIHGPVVDLNPIYARLEKLEKNVDEIKRVIDDTKINFMRQIEILKTTGKPGSAPASTIPTTTNNEDLSKMI